MKKLFKLPARSALIKTLLLISAALLSRTAGAAIPAAEKLLPDNTLVMVTVPDFTRIREIYKTSPQTQLWNDPAMKPFKDHFLTKLNAEIVEPLERELGVSLDSYTSLPQGQLTFAITPGAESSDSPGFLLLLDSKGQSAQLKTNLARLKRKWLESGKSIKTENLRDIEFSVLPLSKNDLPGSLKKLLSSEESEPEDSGEEPEEEAQAEIVFGQFESLLIVGNSTKAVEKVAVHLTGGSTPSLGDLAAFESSRISVFRDTPFFGWANVKSLVDLMVERSAGEESENPMAAMFNVEKIITATGLGGLRTFAFNIQTLPEGVSARVALGAPESTRQGLLNLFPAGKDSAPPAFVPGDAIRFSRARIDGQKAWASVRSILSEFSPGANSSLDFLIDTANEAARQKDPNFDLRKSLFGNLGDDVIVYGKAAKGTTAAELNSAPTLFLIGSPQPDQFAASLKSILTLMNRQAGSPTERDFLGRKIYSIQSSTSPLAAGASEGSTLHYAASAGYVAITTDVTLLEEFLRSSEDAQKQLRDKPGLTEAIAKVGGGSTGWLTYEDQVETTRASLEILRKSWGDTEEKMLAPGIPAFAPENPFKEWVDFSLLPPFEQIAKYFSFTVYTGAANSEGFLFNFFTPTPTGLQK